MNIGSSKRQVLIPVELIIVPPGQAKNRTLNPEIQGKVVKIAASPPDIRYKSVIILVIVTSIVVMRLFRHADFLQIVVMD